MASHARWIGKPLVRQHDFGMFGIDTSERDGHLRVADASPFPVPRKDQPLGRLDLAIDSVGGMRLPSGARIDSR